MMQLKTKRLIIRDPLATDIEGWHRLFSCPKTMYYLPDIMTYSLDDSRQNLDVAIGETQSPNRSKYFFAIEHCETGAFIGTVGYTVTKITPIGKSIGVGYFILPEYHGQGYMPEAFTEVVRFAFEEDNVYRISAGCLTENVASERIMQKCGMIKEAEYKSHTWHDELMKDRVEYRLLKDEWKFAQKEINDGFWQTFDKLIDESEIIIDRPKGSAHPHYTDFVYPLDYGYLKGTTSQDGSGIDVWLGSNTVKSLNVVMCVVDLGKRDSEIKLLIGCTEQEVEIIYKVHNAKFMKGILIRRDK
jgi:ribosomal-protein-alanine N-acetyltransferase